MYSTHDVLHYSGHNFTNKQTNERGWIHYLRQTYTISIKFTLKANKIVSIIITITWQKHYAFASSCSKLYNLRQKKNVHIITIIIFFFTIISIITTTTKHCSRKNTFWYLRLCCQQQAVVAYCCTPLRSVCSENQLPCTAQKHQQTSRHIEISAQCRYRRAAGTSAEISRTLPLLVFPTSTLQKIQTITTNLSTNYKTAYKSRIRLQRRRSCLLNYW